jgi:signal transduction histidine kinase
MLSIVSETEKTSVEAKSKYLKKISEEALASGEALDEIVRNMTVQDEEIEDVIARMRHYAGSVFNNGITVLEMKAEEPIILKKMNLEKRRDLLLAFKEILNNIRKHAEAKRVIINLKSEGNTIFLKVEDDGIGFDVNEYTDRNGIKNIKTRIGKWGGVVHILSEKEKGTLIDIHLPF